MKILTIVVTYNGAKWIDKCFGSLINSSTQSEILVVDNNSTDGTAELIKKKFPEVNFQGSGDNLGFGKANNIGMKYAIEHNFDYVLLLNQDAWIQGDTIEKLINNHLENEDYGVIVPLQMNGSGELIDNLFLEYTIANNRELITNVFKGLNGLQKINFANAACWLIPISTIEKIGGFDPLFPHYGEDDDYLNRLKRHNLKIGMNISTVVYHDREHRTPKKSMKAIVNGTFTRELIEFKNFAIPLKSKTHIFKKVMISGVKFITGGFNRYYLYKIIAYYKLLKVYNSITEHRSHESRLRPHYLT